MIKAKLYRNTTPPLLRLRRGKYDVFGSIIGQSGTAESNYLFTNQEFDSESELYYYNARYYNPNLGRFISRDSYLGRIGDSLSRNGYIYVKNNPLKYIDPTGEEEVAKDIGENFVNKLKESAVDMQTFSDWRDSWSGSWMIPHNMLLNKLKDKLINVPGEAFDNIPKNILAEMEKTPYKFLHFYHKTKPGGDWDYKAHSYPKGYKGLGDVKIGYYTYRNDIPGNIGYGYAGRAGGFSSSVLKIMAGLAQLHTGTSQDKWTWDYSYYDDPTDQKLIQAGVNLYNTYGTSIDVNKVQYFIQDFRNENKEDNGFYSV